MATRTHVDLSSALRHWPSDGHSDDTIDIRGRCISTSASIVALATLLVVLCLV